MDFKKNKEIIAWSLYDFANQPFTTLIVTFIFSKFFVEVLAKNEIVGTSLWSLGIAITAIFVSFLSPILGALADAGGYRKLFLIISTYVCVLATVILFFFEPDQIYLIGGYQMHVSIIALCLFIIANIGFEFGTVFCNSYLTDLSNSQNIGKISGYAWGLGFVGGLLSLAMSLVLFDVSDNTNNVKYINLLVAIWLIVFSLPTFFYLKDQKPRKGFKRHVKSSIYSLITTFKNVSQHQSIIKFLIARLFYNDGIVSILTFGGVYA